MRRTAVCCLMLLLSTSAAAIAQSTRSTATYLRLKAALDAIPAIDTHDHLWPFDRLPGYRITPEGRGMNLAGLWQNSYLTWINPITPSVVPRSTVGSSGSQVRYPAGTCVT